MSKFLKSFEEIEVPILGVRLPKFVIEDKYYKKYKLDAEKTSNFEFLKTVVREGLKKRVSKSSPRWKEYADRCKYELDTIEELGFTDYVLLVWDVINFCRENNIATGLGRGSCVGSLIFYFSDITKVDPIRYGLYFERFISKVRAKKKVIDGITYIDGSLAPDADLDISYYDRGKVIDYVKSKFPEKCCKILTLNTFSGKLCIKECGKVISGKSETEMKEVSDLVQRIFGKVEDLETCYNESKEFKKWCDENPLIYQTALKLRNLIKNKGSHASGYLISYESLDKICPRELTSDKEIISGYDMTWVTLLSIKLDLLGLRNVSVVDDVRKSLNINLEEINLDSDPMIYDNLQNLRTPHGLFQIEADTNYKVCKKVKPKNLHELSAVLSLARPGALAFVDKYADAIHNKRIETIHPELDKILSKTGNVAIYQEQMMEIGNKVFGLDLDSCEILRRTVGKKKKDEMQKWKDVIYEKAKEKNLSQEVADLYWKILNDSADYSFNFSHSSAYASLSALTVYLKFKYPQQFFLSLLKMSRFEGDQIGEISKINKELKTFGIKLLPPNLMKSELDFTIEGRDIRFGLLSIKGISEKSIEKLYQFKGVYSNKFEMFEAANQSKIGIGILSSLVQAGAIDSFDKTRSYTVLEAHLWNILTDKEKLYAMKVGKTYDYCLNTLLREVSTLKDEKGKPIIKESRLATIRKRFEKYKEIYNKNKDSEAFANWYYEKTLLGFPYNNSLLGIFKKECPRLKPIDSIPDLEERDVIDFVGEITEAREATSKKGNKYLKFNVSDENGATEVWLFSDKMERCKKDNGKTPKENNIVIVHGSKKGDSIFADYVTIQDHKIYMKLSDLKNSGEEKEEKPKENIDAVIKL